MATYSDGTTVDVSTAALWTSSNPAMLTIDENGLATAMHSGVNAQSVSLGLHPPALRYREGRQATVSARTRMAELTKKLEVETLNPPKVTVN